ncbi:hypothetical protein CRUP_023048 [Coryphaenoides rupestris]|nr:hypothetical protein CRUP_023048 [Coryphaenoides rupestris]
MSADRRADGSRWAPPPQQGGRTVCDTNSGQPDAMFISAPGRRKLLLLGSGLKASPRCFLGGAWSISIRSRIFQISVPLKLAVSRTWKRRSMSASRISCTLSMSSWRLSCVSMEAGRRGKRRRKLRRSAIRTAGSLTRCSSRPRAAEAAAVGVGLEGVAQGQGSRASYSPLMTHEEERQSRIFQISVPLKLAVSRTWKRRSMSASRISCTLSMSSWRLSCVSMEAGRRGKRRRKLSTGGGGAPGPLLQQRQAGPQVQYVRYLSRSLIQLSQKRCPHSVCRGWQSTSLQASQQYLGSGVARKRSLKPPWRGRKPQSSPWEPADTTCTEHNVARKYTM